MNMRSGNNLCLGFWRVLPIPASGNPGYKRDIDPAWTSSVRWQILGQYSWGDLEELTRADE